MVSTKKQEVLIDRSATGRVQPWRQKKMANELLAAAYEDLNPDKSERLRNCATTLVFREGPQGLTLRGMDSCRVRLCTVCAWRRSKKIYFQTKTIMDAMAQEKGWSYLFLTLTVRNCRGEDLSNTLTAMMQGWNRFVGYKQVKTAVQGWYRGMEITHNVNPLSDSYDTYHPHFHAVLAVRSRQYFQGEQYVSHEEWTSLWQKAMGLNYTPSVDVRKVKGNTAKAVAEAAKYTVKDGDYIIPDDWDLTVDSVRILDSALHKRRLVAFGGVMKDLHKKLNLDDPEDGDLVHLDGRPDADDPDEKLIFFTWNVGYRQYVRDYL